MEIIRTEIDEVFVLKPRVFEDARGYFFEAFSQRAFDEAWAQIGSELANKVGIDKNDVIASGVGTGEVRFVQDNESKSSYGVVRGLHFQKGKDAQSKLVRVVKGAVLDVAVDIRRGSPTFGKWVVVELTEENKLQLFIPRGFAHGFAVLSEDAVFQYKCDRLYAPGSEGAVAWDDVELGIDWRIAPKDVKLSAKDAGHKSLREAEGLFDYNDCLY